MSRQAYTAASERRGRSKAPDIDEEYVVMALRNQKVREAKERTEANNLERKHVTLPRLRFLE